MQASDVADGSDFRGSDIRRQQAESKNAALVGDGFEDEPFGSIEEQDGSAHLRDAGRITDETCDAARELSRLCGEASRRAQYQPRHPATREF